MIGHLLGTGLLGPALWRARMAPVWLAVGLTVALPIYLASVLSGVHKLDRVGWGLTTVAFAAAGRLLLRMPDDEFDLPPLRGIAPGRASITQQCTWCARSRMARRSRGVEAGSGGMASAGTGFGHPCYRPSHVLIEELRMISSGRTRTRCAGRRLPSISLETIISTAARPTRDLGGRTAVMAGSASRATSSS